MKRVAITGGFGWLGWHLACRLRAVHGIDAVRLGRPDLADPDRFAESLAGVDTVFHLAGVNRAATDHEVEEGNVDLARRLSNALERADSPIDVVYADSVQAGQGSAYGRGKSEAASMLAEVGSWLGGGFADVLLPNLFGEHGRPHYNSFVATFAHEIAAGRTPQVSNDREIGLLHAQDAAAALTASAGATNAFYPDVEARSISGVRDLLVGFHELYATRGEIPELPGPFEVNLFNTYRAAAFPAMWPIAPQVHADDRGDLFETVRAHGSPGQSFVSTTKPGQKRGDHYHLHKVERFLVIAGEAEIRLRRLLHHDPADIVTFRVSGERPCFVDMPTLWVHDLTNVGDTDLITLFWADQLLDPDQPDQYPERVTPEVAR